MANDHIVQIIPGGGWWAVYRVSDGTPCLSPLVAWGLTTGGEVVPLDTDCDGYVEITNDTKNFVCLAATRREALAGFDHSAKVVQAGADNGTD